MMRLQQESMYPKSVKTTELVGAVLAWEDKWKKMLRDQPYAKIPDMWKMSAMLKLCPKEIQDMVELRWDEISKFEVLKERVIGWANTKAERGGPVPMDVGWLEEEGGGGEEADWRGCEVCYDGGEIGAVYPTTKCYNCQGYGHMARECPQKGKGKGDMKGGGKMGVKGGFKGYDKGGFKGYGKGGGIKGGFKGDGKGSGSKGFEKGYWPKGNGKGGGYQGTCFNCGKVGHKAAECMVYMVGEMGFECEKEKEIGEVRNEGNPWVVAGVMEKAERKGMVADRGLRSLEAWMPKKIEVSNKYQIFQVENEKEEVIGAIKAEEESGVVRVTVDSGAAKSVWPRSKKGVLRRNMNKKPKLAAANGTKIEVYGEALLEFEKDGK